MTPVFRISGRALALLLPNLHFAPGPVYSALADSITALVLDGRIAPETRLPSERELAKHLALSRATITTAYDTLRDSGFVVSRTGAGSFVTVPATARRVSATRWSPAPVGTDDEIDLSCAALPAPAAELAEALRIAAAELPPLAAGTGYNPFGLPQLRDAVAARFTARGLATQPEQILITNGALHGFDLLLRLLVGPGDRVLTELPTYPGALDALRANGARVVPVPVSAEHGWHVSEMQAALRQTSPRLAFLIPDFHNPTGMLVGERERREVLRVARHTGTTVVIDETFVELGFAGPRRPTATLDSSVITLGSLSKPVWGGLRLGWIRASADMIRRLAVQRAATDLAGSILDQLVGVALLERLDDIADLRREQLRGQRDALVEALHEHLPQWRVTVPEGGMSLWAELDAPLCTSLTLASAQLGIQLVPGSRFGVDGTLERFLRIPFALPPEQLVEGVRRVALTWQRLDHSAASARQLVVA
ncbi:MAG TPA: PLP-dependent aminotransferase family protein [Jatrophihabitantaceae bacterium]